MSTRWRWDAYEAETVELNLGPPADCRDVHANQRPQKHKDRSSVSLATPTVREEDRAGPDGRNCFLGQRPAV